MTTWHFLTPEYPPKTGGVGDYTRLVARTIAATGADVHVWCPAILALTPAADQGITVHTSLGNVDRAAIEATDRQLDCFSKPRRLVLQWVPHGYGWKSMNFIFVRWLCERARRDILEVVFHEAFQDFG